MVSVNYLFYICLMGLLACTDPDRRPSKHRGGALHTQESTLEVDQVMSDTFDYQSLFTDEQQVTKKSKSTDEWQDTLTGGLYWLNLDAMDAKSSQQLQPADPDPPHDYFIAVDREPLLMNIDSVLETVRIAAEIRQQIGPSRIWIKLLINRDGRPKDYFVVKSPDNRVSREILEQLRLIRAKPAYLYNKPVKCWVNIQYNLV